MALIGVTGGGGYVGSQVARELLEAGHQVRATTRDVSKAKEQLTTLGENLSTRPKSEPS